MRDTDLKSCRKMNVVEELTEVLGGYVTENKKSKIAEVLENRTRYLTVMLEDIYQPHNASACLRTCDCLGLQDVHIVEREYIYSPNREVSMGSSKWLDLNRYRTPKSCIETLRARGYFLVATSPNENGCDLLDLPLDRPVAIMFGTEKEGLTDSSLSQADANLRLPMFGFTESYNISVCLAIILSRLVERLHASEIDWKLSETEKKELKLNFYRRIVKRHDLIETEYWENRE